MADYRNWKPEDIWLKIRNGEIDYPTAACDHACPGSHVYYQCEEYGAE